MASLTKPPDGESVSSLAILNHPPLRLPGPQLLHNLVRQHGSQGNAAVEYLSSEGKREVLSYEELHRKSDTLAARITSLTSSHSGDGHLVVPVLVSQQPELYIALLAILKAGGAFCPLNLDAPHERVKFILRDVAARVVITTRQLASAIPEDDSYCKLLLDDMVDQEPPESTRHRQPSSTDLAYVMYTSGSTGTPKGVGVSHEAATQSLLAHDRHIPPFSRFLQFAAPTFDVSVFEIFFPLFRGGTLISCHRARMLNDLPSVINTMAVDACELTPTVAGSLLRKRQNAPCLKLLLTIGEMLTEPVIREFGGHDEVPSMLWAMYGPTEATIHCTLRPACSSKSRVGDIGIPLDTVSAFILKIPEEPNGDKTTQILNVNEVGELAIGGYQLASGYLNRPEQTASVFIDSPYGPLYRTGDKARLLSDGTLECLGRIGGGQVKLRGQRLELGEVEQAALRTPGCHGAVAAVISGILVLFCAVDVVEADHNMVADILATCQSWLPSFMVPGDVLPMRDFPRLPSGKVDRKQLVADYTLRHEQGLHHQTTYKDDLERDICEAASGLLGCNIEPTTSLPASGLDSLVAIRLATSLRQTGVTIGAIDLLKCRTVSQIHAFLKHHHNDGTDSTRKTVPQSPLESFDANGIDAIPILSDQQGDIEEVLPCIPLQSSMLAETATNPRAYCNWVELTVPGHHDEETLRLWVIDLAKRNEVLRTSFVFRRGEFVQIVWNDASTIPIKAVPSLKYLVRDFTISTEDDFLHPFRVQLCVNLSESRILLQIHHAIYDGWTVDLLLADFNKLLEGRTVKERPQFQAVARHVYSLNDSNNSDIARGFWAEYLDGFQPVPLPKLISAIPSEPKTEIMALKLEVDPRATRQVLREIECSPQVLFQAAVAWLWSYYTSQEDTVIGSVTSGRSLVVTGIEEVMGPCIATVPCRTDASQARTIRDLLTSIHTGNRAVLDHSLLPLGEIKKATGILPGQSLFDVLFVYQESLFSRPWDQQQGVREVAHKDYLETKLLVEIEPRHGHYDCRFTYHTDAFSNAVVKVFGEELQSAAKHMLAHLESDTSSLRAVCPPEMLSTHNLTVQPFAGVPDLAKNVEEIAANTPDKVAVCFASSISEEHVDCESLTYRQLNQLANKIARNIRSTGCSTGDVVAIIMEKSIQLYAGILAIVKAGCSYLPLLPTTPRARIEVILTQADVSLCLTDTASLRSLPQVPGVEYWNLEERGYEEFEDTNLNVSPDPSRVANVIYTSGSTGLPKGVCVTQLNITSNLGVLSRIYPVKGDSALLQSCSQAFDVSVFEIFFTWSRGMRLCSASNDTLFEDLERSIRKLGVTHLSMTPTVASLVDPQNVPGVEFLVTSGEPMTEKVARTWARQLYQGYGPSETTNICTVKKMGTEPNEVIQHLGFTFENTSTVVLFQDSMHAVPRGCVGELCFGGDQVAQGYLKMPDLTSAKFITHPTYGRLYRSGDLGRMLPDGSLVIIGRVDDQVKLRGQRIELNEINAVVRESGMVSDCITMLLERSQTSPEQLVSYYAPKELGGKGTKRTATIPFDDHIPEVTATLYQLLSSKVPVYMVPSYLIPLTKLPMTASGKLDRGWLRTTFQTLDQAYLEAVSGKAVTIEDDSEWSDLEKMVGEVVSACLSVPVGALSRWTPLVSFGLDSISGIGLSKALQKELRRRVPVSLVLQNSCVARLAAALDEPATATTPQEDVSLDVFSDELVSQVQLKCEQLGYKLDNILPCTPLQEAMLAASVTGKSYINNMVFRIYTKPETMKEYWLSMVERHQILRTCFVSTDNVQHAFAQVVLQGWRPQWHHFGDSDGSLDECVSKHSATLGAVIDSATPPVAMALVKQGPETYLSFFCHHALYDGIAIERLLHEVEQLASGLTLEVPPPVEPFLKEVLATSTSSENFWKEQLCDFSPKLLPQLKAPELEELGKSHGVLAASASIPLSTIQGKAKHFGSSLLTICQATWTSVLAALLQTDDICFGNVVSGRSAAIDRIDELVAPCFNTVPIRIDLSHKRQNIDLLKYFNALNPKVIQHQFASLRRLQSLVSSQHSQPLFDTLLLLQHPARTLDDRVWTLERDDGEMDIPLVCEFIPSIERDDLSVKLHYDCSFFSKPLIELIFSMIKHSMSYILDYSSSQVLGPSSLPSTLADKLSELVVRRRTSRTSEVSPSSRSEDWSDLELSIRAIFAKLSSASEATINHHTTIYQLGLDSISAVQIASLLRKEGLEVSASDVIQHKTCAKLAQTILTNTTPSPTTGGDSMGLPDFQRQVAGQLQGLSISRASVESVLPCTSLQTGMLMQFLQSQGRDYLNFIDFELHADVDLDNLQSAWSGLTEKHAMLRTGFIPANSTDFSYAMVQYRPSVGHSPGLVLTGDMAQGFTADQWRLAVAGEALHHLHNPPWRAVCVDNGKGKMMHLAIHHALYDAQSLQRLLQHLSKLLEGQVPTKPSPIEETVQDIMVQERGLANREEFWKQQAAEVVINYFPTLTPLKEESRAILVESISSHQSFTDIERSLRHSGVTMQAAVQASWTRLLSSYLGEPSVTFGVVLSGRNSEATKDAVFPCISTLPVVSSNQSSNRDLLQTMMDYSGQLYKQQHTPLTKIQRWLGYPDSRLFDTLLVYQKFADGEETPLPWKIVDDHATVDYPVSMEVEHDDGDKLLYRITFYSDIIPREHARLILEQFDAVLSHLALHPDGGEADLFALAPELFSVIPPNEPELPSEDRFLHQLVESQARKTPDKTALHFVTGFQGTEPTGTTWSYRALDENGNRVAKMLQPHVNTGDIVAVYFDKCPEVFFSILGILKAGCAFVALDPGAPASRKAFIMQDSGASVLLTSTKSATALDFAFAGNVMAVSDVSLSRLDGGPVSLNRPLNPQDVCYCLYTSGTTGTPKGCEITHENAVQAMLAFQKLFTGHWDENSKWLQFASFHFDVSVLEQYWTWSVGITLVAASRDLILEDLAGTISRLEITHIDLTPSLARLLHPDEVPSLCRGVFITGGEQLKQEILDVWGPTGAIHNFYGPTEATIGVTTYPQVPKNGRSSNIGKQFANVGSYVLKPGTETPVLRGGVGELCVSGKLVGKGYLNRPDLTTERFPTLEGFGERVYRTGDLVRILHDGCFDFLGRADDQVKLRGQRLELGEINHTIKSGVPEVVDVATLVIRNEKQQKDLLVSFGVAQSNNNPTQDLEIIVTDSASKLSKDVLNACRAKLPGYMVPTYVFCLPYIPLSSNNKAETRKLKALFNTLDPEQLMTLTKSGDGQLAEAAHRIVEVLSTVERVDTKQVNADTSIFELGVDSISVMRFSTALKRAGYAQATPAMILKNSRLGDLAQALSCKGAPTVEDNTTAARQLVQACYHRHSGQVARELGIDFQDIEYVAPCSPLQEGMITRSKMPGTEGAYFNVFKFELAHNVSPSRLKKAWDNLVESCSILRTRFAQTTDGHVQVASKSLQLSWEEVYLEPPSPDLEAYLSKRHMMWSKANDNNIVKPLEVLFLHLHDGRKLMVVHIFHALYDGNSMDLMMKRLHSYYLDQPLSVSAPSFLEALIHGPLRTYSMSKSFWVSHLFSAIYQPLHAICEQTSESDISCIRRVSIPGLDATRTSLGVTHQAILQAAWVSVVQQFLENITIGMIISGRSIDLPGADDVVGPLFNTVPFHAPLTEDETWVSLIKKCHGFNVAILPFQHVPLRDVQKWCSGGQPLFDTLFSFQRIQTPDHTAQELWTPLESPLNADYPLAFEATLMSENQLELNLVAQAGIANKDTLSNLLKHVEDALNALLTPERPIGQQVRRPIDGFPTLNELHKPSIPSSAVFEWTDIAVQLREEIAQLAEVPVDTVSGTTSLLELGLDSIDMIKLSSRLRKRGLPLTTSQLMKAQTIAAMVSLPQLQGQNADTKVIKETKSSQDASTVLKNYLLKAGHNLDGVEHVLPVTPLQDSMVAEMIQSDFHLYFNHDVLVLQPEVDLHRLSEAWNVVVANSPILRTTFVEVDDPSTQAAYCQLVNKPLPLTIEQTDLSDNEGFSKLTEAARQRVVEGRGSSGLLQLEVAHRHGKRYLVLSIAHALYDGWSLGLLHQDVWSAYHGSYAPRPDYIDYLHQVLDTSTHEARQFWSGFLAGANGTLIPPKKHKKESVASEVHRLDAISSIPALRVKAFCKQHAISAQVLGQACWAAVLASRARSLDVTFGVVLSGRNSEEAERLMFPIMNTVAVRSVLHGNVKSWLLYMQENMTNISTFQQFPLREAQKLVGNWEGPLFNSLFIQQIARRPTELDEKPLLKSSEGSSAVEYPVCVEVEVADEVVTWRTACDSNYMSKQDTEALIQQLDAVLQFLADSPGAELLRFTGQEVSVCGLPSFIPQSKGFNQDKSVLSNGIVKPQEWSITEKEIRAVLSEVSGVPVETIDKNNSVYHLGLDSISTIKVASLLRKKSIMLSPRQMLGAQSITEMAAVADSTLTNPGSTTSPGDSITNSLEAIDYKTLLATANIEEGAMEDILPATAMQVHMLSAWQNTLGGIFHPTFSYTLHGIKEQDVIVSAWRAMIERHPILRTSFISTGSRALPFLQVVHRYAPNIVSFTRQDGTLTGEVLVGKSEPLVTLSVTPLNEASWELRVKIHHALYDGVSLPLLMEDLRQLCQADQQPAEAGLAIWKNALALQVSGATQEVRKVFWTDYLTGATSTSFPRQSTSRLPEHRRTSLLVRSAVKPLADLQSACSSLGVSLQALFFAAYAKYLAKSTGTDDVIFGIYLANRSSAEGVDRLPYPTLSLVPLRVRQPRVNDLATLAKAIQQDLHSISSLENASVGLWEILDWTGIKVDSFINFLSLPTSHDTETDESVTLEEKPWSGDAPVAEERDETSFLKAHPWVKSNAVEDAYPNAVDVEVSVTGEGMDIGVFGPGGMVDAAGAEDVVSAIVALLREGI
ncbi:Nonribosomal Peptide Synthase (NRPS), variant 2 [Coniochaeta pulveracea]|uniref:Nonribosomal Peptide Synthase (NRPS), variant 2 n=1 Tax=Coniochaeta pulveracea TaxID=177199 RepID=A0A420YMG9_9PEZI|nr:Nonribosomal Peptide Synthase (NRPS), variant 2 [Coniochaeta pulveracea]